MADVTPDQEVVDALEAVRTAQKRVDEVVKENMIEAFAEAGPVKGVNATQTTIYAFEDQVSWTDASGGIQTCNGIQVDVRTGADGAKTRTVTAVTLYEAPAGQPGSAPVYMPSMSSGQLPNEVADLVESRNTSS